MFAGGMTVAAPSFMPGVFADFSETDGMLSVSSVYIQGGAVLEIVVNDPDIAITDQDIASGATVDIDGTNYDMVQGANGKWYVYAVDKSVSKDLDNDSTGIEYGTECTAGLGINKGHGAEKGATMGTRGVANIIASDVEYSVWAEAARGGTAAGAVDTITSGSCVNINNAQATDDDASTTVSRTLLSAAILQNAPSLSNWNGAAANATTIDLGQRGHSLNASGYGSWPYILAFEFPGDTLVEYGSNSINVEYGNTADQTSISVLNNSPSDETHIHLTITDPALNMDPTTADQWRFNLAAPSSANHQVFFANNDTDTHGGNAQLSLAQMGAAGFSGNGFLKNSTGSALAIADGLRDVMMVESDVNSGVFESWAVNGTSQIVTVDEVGGDKKVVFTYGGDSADMIITYNDATLTFDAGAGDWLATETAYVTVTDPDLNKYPGSSETLSIGDEDAVIPTIVMGTPLTLASSDGNENLENGDANNNEGVQVGFLNGVGAYTLQVNNTTDNSERLRITHSASAETGCGGVTCIGMATHTHTWINVTTAHTVTDLVNLPGTVVLNYDVSGPAGDLSSTAV
jgi:hypothetical protein